ncbi:hypothetical protein [Mucilaginibacter sp.]
MFSVKAIKVSISKILIAFLFSIICILSAKQINAQVKVFSPSGHRLNFDTVKTYGQIRKSFGETTRTYIVGNKNNLHTVYYIPLKHQAVAVESNDSISALKDIYNFNHIKYYRTGTFDYDFDHLKEMSNVDTLMIKSLLGTPDNEFDNESLYKGKTFFYAKGQFQLHFENGLLNDYTFLNFDGPRKLQLGISDFKINLSESSSDYVTGFKISFFNFSKKRIKYIYITVKALNAVNDLISTKTVRAIGPIDVSDAGSYDWTDLYFSSIIETVKVNSIKVQYFDGTVKIYPASVVNQLFIK